MKITSAREYIESLDCCVWFDGEYNYQDMFGYKTFKTLNGLNKHLAKLAKMANVEIPMFTD